MALLKSRCPQIHVVSRSGLYLLNFVMTPAIAAGGRGVKPSSSGDLTSAGRMNDPMNVTSEKTTRDRLPIRPISPNASFDCLTS